MSEVTEMPSGLQYEDTVERLQRFLSNPIIRVDADYNLGAQGLLRPAALGQLGGL